jgi:hypothetical protein
LEGTASFSGATAAVSVTISVTTTSADYIITYDISGDPTAAQTMTGVITAVTAGNTVTNNDTTDATLTVTGPTFMISSCSVCHTYPPGDGTRDGLTGDVVGAHEVTEHDAIAGNCNKCHVTPGAAEYDHRNGNIEMTSTIHSQTSSSYSKGASFAQTNTPTLGTCDATYCHGTGSFTWRVPQLTNEDACTICHGIPVTGDDKTATDPANLQYKRAPGADGTGVDTADESGNISSNVSDDAQVGAHQVHLNSQNTYGKNVPCDECHAVPATPDELDHWDNTGARDPADMTWGTLATTGSLTPSYSAGSCTNTYCHGNAMPKGSTGGTNKSPAWSTDPTYLDESPGAPTLAGDCDQCHEAPPLGVSPHTGSHTIADCTTCHAHFDADGTLNNITQHIDGVLQAAGDCWDCHGNGSSLAYPPDATYGTTKATADGVGAHVAHMTEDDTIFTKQGRFRQSYPGIY